MTTQDYINEEIQRDKEAAIDEMIRKHRQWEVDTQMGILRPPPWAYSRPCVNPGPSEVILLRAKVRELTDKLAGERERCAKVARDIAELGSTDGDTHVPTAEMIAAKIMEGG